MFSKKQSSFKKNMIISKNTVQNSITQEDTKDAAALHIKKGECGLELCLIPCLGSLYGCYSCLQDCICCMQSRQDCCCDN